MDRYDEIVEQLNSARQKGTRTVQDRLEGILGSLESANAAIRDAMALGAEDLFPLDEIPAAIGEMKEAALEAAKVPPPVVSLDLLRELAGAGNQSDLLHALLESLTAHAARAVVLVFRSNADRWEGIADTNEPTMARHYLTIFDEVWAHSQPASEFRQLQVS